jgi:spore germination protein GerM
VIYTNLGRRIIVVLIAVVAIALIVYYLVLRPMRREEVPVGIEEVPEETRSVTLYFAGPDADRLVPETHEIAVEDALEEQVEAVITELVRGPRGGDKVSSIPDGVQVLQVFWVEDTQTLYIDFNRALVTNHPGGSTGEYYTISTIIKTIGDNFPQVRYVQFLVSGYPVETIAGHYAVDKPLDLLRWK